MKFSGLSGVILKQKFIYPVKSKIKARGATTASSCYAQPSSFPLKTLALFSEKSANWEDGCDSFCKVLAVFREITYNFH